MLNPDIRKGVFAVRSQLYGLQLINNLLKLLTTWPLEGYLGEIPTFSPFIPDGQDLRDAVKNSQIYNSISSNIMKTPSPKCYMTLWDMDILNDTINWSNITPICELLTELDFITDLTVLPNFGGFHRTLNDWPTEDVDTWSCPIGDFHLF